MDASSPPLDFGFLRIGLRLCLTAVHAPGYSEETLFAV